MKMIRDYSFEEIRIPLSMDCKNCSRGSIFGTKGIICKGKIMN